MSEPVVVGLDVAKATVDVALRPSGECWSVPNTDAGAAELVTRLRPLTPALVVCEATRGVPRGTIAAPAPPGLPGRIAKSPQGRGFFPATRHPPQKECRDPGRFGPLAQTGRSTPP